MRCGPTSTCRLDASAKGSDFSALIRHYRKYHRPRTVDELQFFSVNGAGFTFSESEIQAFIDLPVRERTDAVFEVVYEKVLRHFKEDSEGEADNGISNLVLLDAMTNRSYRTLAVHD